MYCSTRLGEKSRSKYVHNRLLFRVYIGLKYSDMNLREEKRIERGKGTHISKENESQNETLEGRTKEPTKTITQTE